jgi:putative transposase
VCEHLGIATTFALPGNARAKIAERSFATLSRVVDDRPEFAGAHAGHAPGASPTADVRPVPIAQAEAVLRREVERHNREAGRRSQGARGRSYAQVFEAGLADRVPRRPTERQLHLASLIYKPVAVDRYGRVHVNGWTYGGPETQDALLAHHGGGRRIWLGRDPQDFGRPAVAYDLDGRLICAEVAPVVPGRYDSADGIREAARNRKHVRDLAAAHAAASRTHDDDELAALLAKLPSPAEPDPAPAGRVVAARFGAPVGRPEAAESTPTPAAVPTEFLRRLDKHLGLPASKAKGA